MYWKWKIYGFCGFRFLVSCIYYGNLYILENLLLFLGIVYIDNNDKVFLFILFVLDLFI